LSTLFFSLSITIPSSFFPYLISPFSFSLLLTFVYAIHPPSFYFDNSILSFLIFVTIAISFFSPPLAFSSLILFFSLQQLALFQSALCVLLMHS